jgi:hypothetical protein
LRWGEAAAECSSQHAGELIVIDWNEVMSRAQHGNPPPDRRVERSADAWRAQLTQLSRFDPDFGDFWPRGARK